MPGGELKAAGNNRLLDDQRARKVCSQQIHYQPVTNKIYQQSRIQFLIFILIYKGAPTAANTAESMLSAGTDELFDHTAVVITFLQSQLTADQLASPTILPMEE